MEIVKVVWVDAHSHAGWISDENVESIKPVKVVSVGILVESTDDFVKLAFGQTIKDSDCEHPDCHERFAYDAVISIPAALVKEMVILDHNVPEECHECEPGSDHTVACCRGDVESLDEYYEMNCMCSRNICKFPCDGKCGCNPVKGY